MSTDPTISSLSVRDAAPSLPVQASDASASSSSRPSLPAPVPPLTSSSGKQAHWRSDSQSSISTQSPPPKRTSTFTSPDRNELKEALKAGGAMNLDIQVERVKKPRVEPVYFHPIPSVDLDQIVHNRVAFSVLSSESFPGKIQLNSASDAMLGVGAFKTAQMARMTLMPLRSSGLGSQANDQVVIKRTYTPSSTRNPNSRAKLTRPSPGEQAQVLYREANVLYWSKALLKMTYDYVDHCINEAAEPPPFEIPRLRFVDAGLVLVYPEHLTNAGPFSGKSNAGSPSSVYLAEEVIPSTGQEEGIDSFIKFIVNGYAGPRRLHDPVAKEIAEFLSFTQHVQYTQTGGLVFLSDYEGCPPLLTDPQVLTHHSIGKGERLFSGGNDEEMVSLFELQHVCNKFCVWPSFHLEAFSRAFYGEPDV